jgi:hypothetical protein
MPATVPFWVPSGNREVGLLNGAKFLLALGLSRRYPLLYKWGDSTVLQLAQLSSDSASGARVSNRPRKQRVSSR